MPELLTRKFSCPDWNWRDRLLKADKNNSESFMYEGVSEKKTQSLKNPWGLCIYLFIIGNTGRCFSRWMPFRA